ncbi:MAG: DNA methyltransferase [Bacteroidales bacterium]|nr:DNA methyltransferase [Bacteroidales bacterium]
MNKNIDYKKDLAEKLEELKEIEGFPIGTDEDILALSEPPYYTACPNPYIKDFIEEYGSPYDEETDDYHREPFVGDVSEGKNHPIYNAHSYHTKVPHKAIIQYIEHYTNKNDIVLDGFSGSGMTGIAAQFSKRKVILSDLSPYATFISAKYNNPEESELFINAVKNAINDANDMYGWMYETSHNSSEKGIIQSTIWSDILRCPFCAIEYVFFNEAIIDNELNSEYKCPHCNAAINKKRSLAVLTKKRDIDNEIIEVKKQVPVLIDYKVGNKRFSKSPDEIDIKKLDDIELILSSEWFPTNKMLFKGTSWGDLYRAGYHIGVTKTHHFYTNRSLIILAFLRTRLKGYAFFFFTSLLINSSKMSRFGKRTGNVSGTLYMPTLIKELNILEYSKRKLSGAKGFVKPLKELQKIKNGKSITTTQSCTDLFNISNSTIDYIFTDPPFGDNLPYSELSFIQEAWLKVFTNNEKEGIISNIQNKKLLEYNALMLESFREYYRVLKPKRWITVIFHNSKSAVWNGIQEAITKAGFMIAQVSTLDKQQGSFKQVTAAGTVANDLVISAFKPSNSFSERFLQQAGEGLEVIFINEFLTNLPIKPTIERTEKMLYSKMLAYYIQRSYEVNYDAKSFYSLLKASFVQEDGFWFTKPQIEAFLEYKKKMKLEGDGDIKSGHSLLFVNDEKSALVWLYNFLSEPKTFSDISIAFNQVANIQDDDVPELSEMLEQNFVVEAGKYRRPEDELEQNEIIDRRQRSLRREFETLLVQAQTHKSKIKLVRKEALAYGFELCYKEKRFADIISVAEKLDNKILENSGELNDFVEVAEIMIKGIS